MGFAANSRFAEIVGVSRMIRAAIFYSLICLALGFLCTPASYAGSSQVELGRSIAQEHCARCHGVGRTDESPLEQAPPFRRLHERYPVEQLAEAFAEGIVVGHTEMPPFAFKPAEVQALLAYLKSLERQSRK
jgi:cytochrome c